MESTKGTGRHVLTGAGRQHAHGGTATQVHHDHHAESPAIDVKQKLCQTMNKTVGTLFNASLYGDKGDAKRKQILVATVAALTEIIQSAMQITTEKGTPAEKFQKTLLALATKCELRCFEANTLHTEILQTS